MTADELISEGRRIQRRTVLLAPDGTGDCAAIWYGNDADKDSADDQHCWLTVNTHFVPSCPLEGWLSIYTDDLKCQGGRCEVTAKAPTQPGTKLFARDIAVLPPIEAVFRMGSPAVEHWLRENNWEASFGYSDNFPDRLVAKAYQSTWFREHPLYQEGIYATLGGWHFPWPDGDWHDLINDALLVQTFMDAEPWVEVWRQTSGALKVFQRIT